MYKFLVGLVMALICGAANATYTCTGPVVGVEIAPDGQVNVQSLAGTLTWTYLCSVQGTANNVTQDACKAIYTTLLAAQLSGQPVTLWFNDSLTCTTHPTWTWLTGWYFGPAVSMH